MEICVIAPGSDEQEFSMQLRIGSSLILYNVPPGAYRGIAASRFARLYPLSNIIIMDNTPQAIEGLIGMLCTLQANAGSKCNSETTVLTRRSYLVSHLNDFTYDRIFVGTTLDIAQGCHRFKDYQLKFVAFGGTFITIFETGLCVRKSERDKIKQLNLSKQQSRELYKQGQTEVAGQVVRLEDLKLTELHSGNVIVIPRLANYESVVKVVEQHLVLEATNFVFTPKRLEGLLDCKQYLTYQNSYCSYYPILGFSAYFYFQTGQMLSAAGKPDCQGMFIKCFPAFYEVNELAESTDATRLKEIAAEKEYYLIARPPHLGKPNTLVTLGTGASLPNKYNNVAGNLVNDRILVDAGEGTFYQFVFYLRTRQRDVVDFLPRDLLVLITHEHADHYLGVCSILKAYFSKFGRYPKMMANPVVFKYIYLVLGVELKSASQLDGISTVPVFHAYYSVAYIIRSQDSHLYVSGDCRPQKIYALQNLTVLHEGTFYAGEREEALARGHSTIEEAALHIREAQGVAIFTHFSQRYARDLIQIEGCWKAGDLFVFEW